MGHLATASPGGYPNVAPVWFVVDGGDLVFTTGFDTTKGRHPKRLAQRYVPAGQAQEYGIRNALPSEMLCRLTMQRVTGERAIAI
jgi:hypothetical protein